VADPAIQRRRLSGALLCGGLCLGALGPVWAQTGSYERFFAAIQRDDVRSLQRLLALGFDVNSPSPELEPPLVMALQRESLRVARYLVGLPELDLEALNPAGENALMLAALRGHLDIVQALVARGAQVNRPGWTPLHYAATHDGPQALPITLLLLEHHAFIDATSPNGTTPLMMAAQYGHPFVVARLLREGAEHQRRNQQGLTALDFAQRGERPDAIRLLSRRVLRPPVTGSW
jgi:uncharacterized protein